MKNNNTINLETLYKEILNLKEMMQPKDDSPLFGSVALLYLTNNQKPNKNFRRILTTKLIPIFKGLTLKLIEK